VADLVQRIAEIVLDERTVVSRSQEIERERATAIADLVRANQFAPVSKLRGPFRIELAVTDGRLALDIVSLAGGGNETIGLSLRPFARTIKDYFLICESYSKALKAGNLAQVEAIDMGRRGLHNDGAALLIENLSGKILVDHDTARRLFTLICVLHLKASAHGLGSHAHP
jgi:uncharacterized protein (UPF0262 family)